MTPASSIKTLASTGLTTNGPVTFNSAGSWNLTPSGFGLFSAAANKVRIPDNYIWPISNILQFLISNLLQFLISNLLQLPIVSNFSILTPGANLGPAVDVTAEHPEGRTEKICQNGNYRNKNIFLVQLDRPAQRLLRAGAIAPRQSSLIPPLHLQVIIMMMILIIMMMMMLSREEAGGMNVFSRLTAGTNIGERQYSNKGVINPFQVKICKIFFKNLQLTGFCSFCQGRIVAKSPLICTNVAEGHCKAQSPVFATDELNPVSSIKTLSSSGLTTNGPVLSLIHI